MSDLIYVGFLLAGAITLVIEAYRNFNAPNARHPFELHPILKEVEVRNLCTTGEVIGGFVFYALLYLLAYGVVLSSAEVYGLLAQASDALGEIGAADGAGSISDASINDILTASSGDYSKPLVVSALIISSLSIGAVKPIEITMRSLAHRLSGVPRGVYRVIEHLQVADFEAFMKGYDTPLVHAFRNKISKLNETPVETREKAIIKSLTAIDCLSMVADAEKLSAYFPLRNLERLKPLIDKVHGKIDELEKRIKDLDGDKADHAASYDTLESMVKAVRSDVVAVFAVLYIRNDHAVFSRAGRDMTRDPIDALKLTIADFERQEHNAFGGSILAALVVSLLLASAVYFKWVYWAGIGNSNVYRDAATGTVPPHLADCTTDFSRICEGVVLEWRDSRISEILEVVFWDQLQAGLITFASVLLVILGREVRVEQQSWRTNWTFSQFPFLKLLAMSLLSAIAAIFVTAFVQLARFWWDAEFEITRTQIVGLFEQSGQFILLQAIGGLILGMSALIIMDKHQDPYRSMRFTLMLACAGGLAYFLFEWATMVISVGYIGGPAAAYFSQTVRDAMFFSLLPAFFLLFFALLLELGERDNKAKPADVAAPAEILAAGTGR